MDVLGVVLAIVLVAILLLGSLVLRRRGIGRRGGVFDCSLRERPAPRGKGWMLGVARYAEDTVEWYRMFSFAARPRHNLCRRNLVVRSRRVPSPAELHALLPGSIVIECAVDGRPLELAMGEDALTGFLAWLESAPPGRDVNVA